MPTKNFTFHVANIDNDKLPLVFSQGSQKHRYENKLREIEIARREAYYAALASLDDSLAELKKKRDDAREAVNSIYKEIKAGRVAEFKRLARLGISGKTRIEATEDQSNRLELAKSNRKVAQEAFDASKKIASQRYAAIEKPIKDFYDTVSHYVALEIASKMGMKYDSKSLVNSIEDQVRSGSLAMLESDPQEKADDKEDPKGKKKKKKDRPIPPSRVGEIIVIRKFEEYSKNKLLCHEAIAYHEKKKAYSDSECLPGSKAEARQAGKKLSAGPPPKFKKWDGCFYLSALPIKGSTSEVFSGDNNTVKAEVIHKSARSEKRIVRLTMKLSKTDSVTFDVTMHRPIPQGLIKCVHLHCNRSGTRNVFSVRFVVEFDAAPETPTSNEAVAIHPGCRMVTHDKKTFMRVAVYATTVDCGEDADHVTSKTRFNERKRRGDIRRHIKDIPGYAEVLIEKQVLDMVRDYELIKSKRDTEFDVIAAKLYGYRSCLRRSKKAAFFLDATETAYAWKSPGRIVTLHREWANNRFPGDDEMFCLVAQWLKDDERQHNRSVDIYRRFVRHRDDFYRRCARRLSRLYSTVHIPICDWKLMKAKNTTTGEYTPSAVRRQMAMAAPGRMIQFVKEAFGKSRVVEVSAKFISKKCDECGHIENIDMRKASHTCSKCKTERDVDFSAAWLQLVGNGNSNDKNI